MGREVIDLGFLGIRLQDQPEPLAREPRATVIHEERRLVWIGEAGTAVLQVIVDCLDGLGTQWDPPPAPGLAWARDLVGKEIDIVSSERHELADIDRLPEGNQQMDVIRGSICNYQSRFIVVNNAVDVGVQFFFNFGRDKFRIERRVSPYALLFVTFGDKEKAGTV